MRHLLLLPMVLFASNISAAACTYEPWTQYRGTKLYRHADGSTYTFQTSKVKVDADGAPNAYHPADVGKHCTKGTGFKGLDCPANAGYPEGGWKSVLVVDPKYPTRPYIQQPPAEFAGYFVSKTSLSDRSNATAATDPAKYVDSRTVPYVIYPRNFYSMSGTGVMGDFGYAMNLESGKGSPFIVAETGPAEADLGEMSIALAVALGGVDPNPRTGKGAPSGKIVYVVFPRSRADPPWPQSNEDIAARAQQLLEKVGGIEGATSCK